MEASLCAAYAPRNPLAEFWRGEITLRHLRVLIEGLPTDSALARAVRGPWADREWILWHVESRLRESLSVLAAIASTIQTGRPVQPDYLATPDATPGQLAAQEQKAAQERSAAHEQRAAARQLEMDLIPREE